MRIIKWISKDFGDLETILRKYKSLKS